MTANEERAGRIAAVVGEYLRAVVTGSPSDLESWTHRHPELMPELDAELRKASLFRTAYERTQSLAQEDTPTHAAGPSTSPHSSGALRVRCPHCHVLQEVAGDEAGSMFNCTACGSRYSLVEDDSSADASHGARRVAHFELLERLGSGGFGAVWKARDTQLGRFVALKLPRRRRLSAVEAELFLREARAAAQLQHPGIVSIYEVGRDGDSIYIVSELIEGVSLAEWLVDQRMSAREAAVLCVEIAEALAHAHQHGVIHRDLKPANVLLDAAGGPHIADFGLARREAGEVTMTVDGQLIGTPAYMSPEQARGDSHTSDARSDIYSLGVILFELLTSEVPFRGATANLLHQVIHDEPPSARKLNNRIPRDLETIALKCLEKDPARRYATAFALKCDLERFLCHEPITARRVSRMERGWRWCRKRPTTAGMSGTLLLMLLALAIAGPILSARYRVLAKSEAEQKRQAFAAAASATTASQSALRELELKRHALYAINMNLAQHFWKQGNVGRLREILTETTDYDQRGFEWYYWQRRLHRNLHTFRGHQDAIYSVAVSPDGQRLITGSLDHTARVWDLASGRELLCLSAHRAAVNAVAFSPDGRRVATGSADQTARVWDAFNGKPLVLLKGHLAGITSLAFSPDQQELVTGSLDFTARIWDLPNGRVKRTLDGFGGTITSVGFDSDGQRLLIGSDDHWVTVWDSSSGDRLQSLAGHDGPISAAAFFADGTRIVTACWNQTATVWDALSGRELVTFRGHGAVKESGISALAVSPDGKRIATVGNVGQTIKIWDASSARELLVLQGHGVWIGAVAFTPDGQRLITGSDDRTAKVWELNDGGEQYGFGGEGKAFEHDPSSDKARNGMDAHFPGRDWFVEASAISSDGKYFVTSSWESPAQLCELKPAGVRVKLKVGMTCAAFSPDNRRLLTARHGFPVTIWDSADGRELTNFVGHGNHISSAAFSPDGQLVVTGSWDGTAILWNVESGAQVRTFQGGAEIDAVAFSSDARRIAAACGPVVKIWDVDNGREILSLQGHTDNVSSIAFSPDCRRVATGSYDQTAKLWDAASGRERLTLRGHGPWYVLVAFSPDGRRLVTASWDATAKVWDTITGSELLTLEGHANHLTAVTFSRDGRRIVTADNDRTVRIWNAASAEDVAAWNDSERPASVSSSAPRREPVDSGEAIPTDQRRNAGAIREWLVLSPIPFEGIAGVHGLMQPVFAAEAELAPREADRVRIGSRDYTWQAVRLADNELNFNELAGRNSPSSIAFAVAYLDVPVDVADAVLNVGTDDQAIIYLNGQPIYQLFFGRKYQAGQDVIAEVHLKAGRNTVVMKVVNQLGDWLCSLRVTDRDGRPVPGLKTTLEPGLEAP